MNSKNSLFGSMQGYSLFTLGGTLAVLALTVVCYKLHDPAVERSWGVPRELFEFLAATYGPVIVATAVSFRDVLFETFVQIGGDEPPRMVPIKQGVYFLYGLTCLAFLVAGGVVFWISSGASVEDSKWAAGLAAGFWGFSLGSIFQKFFQEYKKHEISNENEQQS